MTSPIVTALEVDRWYRLYCRAVHDGAQVSELFCVLRGRDDGTLAGVYGGGIIGIDGGVP